MARHINLTQYPKVIQLAAHAIGLDHKRPYIRYGKRYFRPWRNYFTTPADSQDWKEWEWLCEKGYAEVDPPGKNISLFRFRLTPAGLNWLGTFLGIIIQTKET